jgi:tetraprenyl-beta-curcumene synthase
MGGTVRSRLRVTLAFAWAIPLYWVAIFPLARQELRRWERRAEEIPDPTLRSHALHKLRTEHFTAEGAAAFAILATACSIRHVVRLCVAFEVIYDYLDALAEQPVADVLANNRALYAALSAAVSPDAPFQDHYANQSHHDDGGYLQALIRTCRASLVRLPAHTRVLPTLERLTDRAATAQSLHHASALSGCAPLAEWASGQSRNGSALRWWELAAAAGSPLGVFAVIAAAGHPQTDERDAIRVEEAYFPWIAALSWLLEGLVDHATDVAAGAQGFVAHYASSQETAERLETIARRAAHDARRLPGAGRHTLLLAGMASMYLSHEGASASGARPAAAAVSIAIGWPLTPLLCMLRLRRRLTDRTAYLPGEA